MRVQDLAQETYSAIMVNKARSILTILGIVIGIGSVIAMISLGQGAQSEIENRIQSIGSNLLTVYPGAQRGAGFQGVRQSSGTSQTLKLSDAQAIEEKIKSALNVEPEVSSRYQVTAKGANSNTSVIGTTPKYLEVKNAELSLGSFVSEQNVKMLSKVAVLGPATRDELFGVDANPLGQKIRINKLDFTVIGVIKSKGGSGLGSADEIILVPLSTAQTYFIGSDRLSSINIQIKDQEAMSVAAQEITSLMLARHNIADPSSADFNVFNQADIVAAASSVTQTFTLLLGAVAGISLLVGGIGIMNMMLTTVTERTREIGLRKALGATRDDVSNQFLAEATTLTFLGGVIGVIFGWAIAMGISKLGGITTQVAPYSVLLAFGVSAAIGIIFGYYPARRAAKLDPIYALKYE